MKAFLVILFTAGAIGVSSVQEKLQYVRRIENLEIVKMENTSSFEQSGTGTIRGKVFLSQAGSKAVKTTRGLYGKSTSRLTKNTNAKQAVVFIQQAAGNFAVPQVRPAMRQTNITIVPHVLPVLKGTTVEFPNDDNIFHNIFSLSSTRTFDLGRYSRGTFKTVSFDRLGEVKIFCDIHSTMSGFVLVLQNPYYSVTNADGSYSISGIPAGNYKLGAWSENGIQWKDVSVGAGVIDGADFSF